MKLTIAFILLFLSSFANSFAQEDSTINDYVVFKLSFKEKLTESDSILFSIKENGQNKSSYLIKVSDSIFLLPKDSIHDSASYWIDVDGYNKLTDSTFFLYSMSTIGLRILESDTSSFKPYLSSGNGGGIVDPIIGIYNHFNINLKEGNSQTFRREDIIRINRR